MASAAPREERPGRGMAARVGIALLATVIAFVLLVPSVIGTGRGLLNPKVGLEEIQDIGFIFNRHQSKMDTSYKDAYHQVLTDAHFLEHMNLPIGDVVADTADSCIPSIYTNVDNPRIFVITNDRDFQRVLADPLTFHAHYYLVSVSRGASADAVDVAYPNKASRAHWSVLVHTFGGKGACGGLYLYKVIGHPQGTF